MLTVIITFTGLPPPTKPLQLLMVLEKNKTKQLTVGPEGEEAVRQSSSEEREVNTFD